MNFRIKTNCKNNFCSIITICVLLLTLFQLKTFAQESPSLILPGHNESINCLAYSPDGQILISGSKDGKIKVWDVQKGFKEKKTISIGTASISGLSFSHSGKMIAVGTYKELQLFDATTLKRIRRVKKAHASFVKSVHFSGDDKMLVSSSWKLNALMIWNIPNLKKIIQLKEEVWTDDADFTPDGKFVVSANHANTAKLWDINSGNLVKIFAGHEDWLYAVKVTSDQKKLITAGLDKVIKTWDLNTGKFINSLEGHTEGITGLSLSADNRYIASCALDSTILIWDLSSEEIIGRLKSQSGILSVVFSPDMHSVASAGNDHNINIWDIRSFLKKD